MTAFMDIFCVVGISYVAILLAGIWGHHFGRSMGWAFLIQFIVMLVSLIIIPMVI